jgi:hypothetical protein
MAGLTFALKITVVMNGSITRLTQDQIAEYEKYEHGCGQNTSVSKRTCNEKVTHRYDLSEASWSGRREIHHPLCDKHTAEALKMGAESV